MFASGSDIYNKYHIPPIGGLQENLNKKTDTVVRGAPANLDGAVQNERDKLLARFFDGIRKFGDAKLTGLGDSVIGDKKLDLEKHLPTSLSDEILQPHNLLAGGLTVFLSEGSFLRRLANGLVILVTGGFLESKV